MSTSWRFPTFVILALFVCAGVCLEPCVFTSDCIQAGTYACDPGFFACVPACAVDADCPLYWAYDGGMRCDINTSVCCGRTGLDCCTSGTACVGPDQAGTGSSVCDTTYNTCT